MAEVVIDGVRYAPVSEAAPTVADVLRTLALQYTTPDDLAERDAAEVFRTMGVLVGEFEPDDGAETLQEFGARLVEQLPRALPSADTTPETGDA